MEGVEKDRENGLKRRRKGKHEAGASCDEDVLRCEGFLDGFVEAGFHGFSGSVELSKERLERERGRVAMKMSVFVCFVLL